LSFNEGPRPARISFILHSDKNYFIVQYGSNKSFEEMAKRVEKAVQNRPIHNSEGLA
jgi:hypothetical protein